MRKTTFIFLMVLLTILLLLFNAANQGSLIAIVTLAVLLTILLIFIGAGIALIAVRAMAKREERNFQSNMAENLAMMRQYQTLLTAQNLEIMKAKQLPAPAGLASGLIIDETAFQELDQ